MFHDKLKLMSIAAAAMVAATVAVVAQTGTAPAPQAPIGAKGKGAMAACRTDIKTLCGSIPRKGGARMKCLVENRSKASAECQATITAVEAGKAANKASRKEARKLVRDVCKIDARAICSTAEKGNGGRLRCLRENSAKLSPTCAQAVAAVPVSKREAAAAAKSK